MRDYPMMILPLPEEDGGGYQAMFPDLPGCVSDGETPSEAAENAQDALRAWLEVRAELGGPIPEPGSLRELARAKRSQLLQNLHALAAMQARDSASWEEVRLDLSKSAEDFARLEAALEEQERILEALRVHLGLESWDELPLAVGMR